ncbi:hypothetical protein F967_02004 [Acinetobacter sp. CIP 102637]|uniref:restriction endonuclease subunit S n=2 Tax=Gammaproteobacteria TaxID=1236 RepID=UPI0002D0E234|nr:restriction endonuclease subunit S [Acinetobacter sp. CIP 102637]ENV05255.1 hypothetical protein F967_02004 [Acinetobacter sp. CIP 102637]
MAAPKLRFKEFDGDWSESKLKDCIDSIDSGWSPQCESYPADENEWAVLKTTSVNWDGFKANFNKKLPSNLEARFEIEVKPNDILVTRAGPTERVGVVAVVPHNVRSKLMISDKLIRLKADNENNPEFLGISLSSVKCQNQLQSKTSGLAKSQTNISQKILCDVSLMTPAKAEQTKIASFLSAVDEKISQLTQKHELLSQYKQGMMQKLFSQQIRFKADDGSEFGEWEKIKFLDLMVDLWDYRGKTPKKLGMDWGDGEIQSLSALNIKKGFIDFDADCHLGSEKLYKTWMNKGDLEKDDIIFTMEAPLGNVALIPDDRKYILSQRVVCFKTNKKMIDNKFIFQLILSDQFQSRIEELATGTTAKGINQKSMQKIEVTLPPKDEQTKIASFLSAIDQKVDVVAQQIEQAKTWKKGLLQQMFV